jgi:hypothetical protein
MKRKEDILEACFEKQSIIECFKDLEPLCDEDRDSYMKLQGSVDALLWVLGDSLSAGDRRFFFEASKVIHDECMEVAMEDDDIQYIIREAVDLLANDAYIGYNEKYQTIRYVIERQLEDGIAAD